MHEDNMVRYCKPAFGFSGEYVEENFGSMTVAKTLDKIDKKVNYRCHRSSKAISKSSGYYFETIFGAL